MSERVGSIVFGPARIGPGPTDYGDLCLWAFMAGFVAGAVFRDHVGEGAGR